jgi:hypothetical protein
MRRHVRLLVMLSVFAMLASVPLIGTSAGAARATGPQVHVTPHAIAQGQTVTFRGSGWTPGARVTVWICGGTIVSSLPKTVQDADFLSFRGCSAPAFANGPRFSVAAQLTQVQTYTSGCSRSCFTAQFTCGPGLGDCFVLATTQGAAGLELATAPIRFRTSHPTLTVTPTKRLSDGQTLTVTMTGLAPYEASGVMECVSPWRPKVGRQPPRCTPVFSLVTDASGTATGTFRVWRILNRFEPTNQQLDCAELHCVIQSSTVLSLHLPLTFDPSSPIIRPTMTVTPRDELADGQTVTVTGHNFAPGTVALHECAAGAAAIGNQGITAASRVLDVCSSGGPGPVNADQSGAFSASFPVSKHFMSFSGKPMDCTTGFGCVIDGGFFPTSQFNSGFLDVPITFRP